MELKKVLLIFLATFLILLTFTTTTTINGADISEQRPNQVDHVDLKTRENVKKHHTSLYKQISNSPSYASIGPSIVLRRGDSFDIKIHLRQTYDPDRDKIRVELAFGSTPKLDKGTLIYLPISKSARSQSQDTSKWTGNIIELNGAVLDVRMGIPANAAVGVWKLSFTVKLAGTKDLRSYTAREAIYILFNPWCKDDTVYLPREDARQEYVLADIGKVYMGSYMRPLGTRWSYGQFSEYVLPGMMMLLDKTRLDFNQRSDVVKMSRAVSAAMNSHDDRGLLVGNWSGNYLEGTSPWSWSGSATIFERYVKSNCQPVKFGQCWVFGGLTTTALRTLGIPARTITNFMSAHDTDLSLTVDQFGVGGINGDSIWNFHVWTDAWMLREDLPAEYSGWQAIDATPQETSMGAYQLGPASLEAVKRGRVNFAYDVGFVYSEVNADVVTWQHDPRAPFQWRLISSQTDHVGRKILTKQVGYLDESRYGTKDAEDITIQYKFPEGSREERLYYREAIKHAGLEAIMHG